MVRVLVILAIAIFVIVTIAWFFGIELPNTAHNPNQPATSTQTNNQPTTSPATTTPAGSQLTYRNADSNFIQVTAPTPGGVVLRTFSLQGRARGNWYFEASFPIEILDANNTRIMQMPVQAMGEWMTTDFVPFSTQVTIPGTYTGPATLVLHRDNPSGMPENDASVSIPIVIQ